MPFQKGKSGNPKGRPPKHRALTEILEKAGRKTITDVDGKRRAGNRVVARLLWEIATTGQCAMPDGKGGSKTLQPQKTDQWFEIVKWIYRQVDGGAPKQLDVQSGGEPIQTNVLVVREIVGDET